MWKRAGTLTVVTAAVLVIAAACAQEERDSPSTGPGRGAAASATEAGRPVAGGTEPSGPVMGMGPGISISEAIASTLDGPLLINGFVVADGDSIRFCEALAESHPPQCAGPSLSVEGLDLDSLDGLESEGSVTWSPQPVQLLGEVEGDTLQIDALSTG